MKRMISVVLSALMIMGCLSDLLYAYAAAPKIVIEEYQMDSYRAGKRNSEYYTYPEKEGYIFAGWYKTEECRKEDAIGISVTTGKAYARFVEKDVLSVRGQILLDSDVDSKSTSLRMVTTVDTLQYQNVGFLIKIGDKLSKRITDDVYTTLYGYEYEDENKQKISYVPKDFSDASNFFMAYRISGIPNSAFLTGIDVTPMWTTLDGTTVQGVLKSFTINGALGEETITLKNANDRNHVYYTVDKPVKAGQSVQFDVNVTTGQKVEISVLGNGSWNQEYFSKEYETSSFEKVRVTTSIPKDIDSFVVCVKFKEISIDFSENVVTISNIKILGSMSANLMGISGNNRVEYTFDIDVKQGQIFNFDIDVEPAQEISVWVYGDQETEEYFARAYNPWPGKTTIQTEVPADESQLRIIVQFNNGDLDYGDNVVKISDVKVMDDWMVTSKNPSGGAVMAHTFDMALESGQSLNFDIDITEGQNVEILVKGDDTGDVTFYQKTCDKWSGKQSITVSITKELKNFDIWVKYTDANTSLFNNVVNISNISVLGGTIVNYGEVWSAPSTVKVEETETNTKGETKNLVYEAVRNEYESKQLIITASKDVSYFELFASDLASDSGTISSQYIDIYVQKYVQVASTDYYGASSMPDALIPMEAADGYDENTIKAGKNGALWITIYIPEDSQAGTYTGTFQLVMYGVDGEISIDIPVEVKVHNYTLTDDVTARSLFTWRYDRVAAGELDGSIEMMTDYYEFFENYRISLQSLPLETLSGEEYATMVEKYYDDITSYTILSEIGDISSGIIYKKAEAKEQILAIAKISTPEKNLFDKAMFYFIDEPDLNQESYRTDVLKKIEWLNSLLEECVDEINTDPDGLYTNFKAVTNWQDSILKIPNVIPVGCYEWLIGEYNDSHNVIFNLNKSYVLYIDDETKEFWQALNCICPYYAAFTEDHIKKLQVLCEKYDVELWWYGMLNPKAPAPTYHIGDSNLLSSRTVSWLQQKYGIGGNLYWDAAAYTTFENGEYDNRYIDLFESPYRVSGVAGDGFLTYPGEAYGVDGPLPSLRLMSIRDGMEEYEILKAVEDAQKVNNMDGTFYSKIAAEGVTNMYADGENGLDFDTLRSTLLGYAEDIATLGNDGKSDEPVFHNVQINKDNNLITGIEKRLKTELLFSFESYKDITGTHIKVGNQLGATCINKDQDMITEGKGSWLIKPQGNYGKDGYPYFRMQCTDSTFTTNNFNAFDKLLLDVYNASSEEVTIKWSLSLFSAGGDEVETEEIYCTLAPNAWTTCEYDLSDEAYSQFFYLNSVNAMTITFMTKKDDKTDTVPEIYLDNLRGNYLEGERVMTDFTYSFEEGLTLDNLAERYVVFSGGTISHSKFEVSRIAYEDIGLSPAKASCGKYALQGDATGAVWPRLTANLDKTYTVGSVLSFWMYVDVEEGVSEGKTFYMESSGNSFIHTNYRFNTWVKVNIVLGADSEKVSWFLNFDDNNTGTSILGDASVRVYMDDFRIYANEAALVASMTTINKEGTVVQIDNDFGGEYVQYDITGGISKGSTVNFDIDFNSSEAVTVWVMANGQWDVWKDGVVTDKNEYFANIYGSWNENKSISALIEEDAEFVRILVRYGGDCASWSTRECVISNLIIRMTEQEENTESRWGPIS